MDIDPTDTAVSGRSDLIQARRNIVQLAGRRGANGSAAAWLPTRILPFDREHPIAPDIVCLDGHGFSRMQLALASRAAAEEKVAASRWMIDNGFISESGYLARLAASCGLSYSAIAPHPDDVQSVAFDPSLFDAACAAMPRVNTAIAQVGAARQLIVAPDHFDERLPAMLAGLPTDRPTVIVPSQTLRLAVHGAQCRQWLQQARSGLSDSAPRFSARQVFTTPQSVFGIVIVALLLAGLWRAPELVIVTVGLLLSLYYLGTIFLRASLLAGLDAIDAESAGLARPAPAGPLPIYSVMVALHDEAGQVPDLLAALERLDWPQSRLEVFLICEADDDATVAAIKRRNLPEHIHLVTCPPCLPRTKPKALNFALPLCRGEFTVIYDAEDRPEPDQLRQAWTAFGSDTDERLACVQAPLSIHNRGQNWLTAMFAIEYDTLFRGMLPVLAARGAPMPLGGTSNHFRTAVLRDCGGWDPFNVTEDADLGIRLARAGYRCATLAAATHEEAPSRLRDWFKQRTRWLKGWMQTILVHTRHPVLAASELGWRGTLYFHLLLSAIVISILAHPVFLVQSVIWAVQLAGGASLGTAETLFLGLCAFNLAGGYLVHGFFAYEVMRRRGAGSGLVLFTLPLYWVLISLAGWRALFQLFFSPFHWEKTPHGLANGRRNANIRS